MLFPIFRAVLNLNTTSTAQRSPNAFGGHQTYVSVGGFFPPTEPAPVTYTIEMVIGDDVTPLMECPGYEVSVMLEALSAAMLATEKLNDAAPHTAGPLGESHLDQVPVGGTAPACPEEFSGPTTCTGAGLFMAIDAEAAMDRAALSTAPMSDVVPAPAPDPVPPVTPPAP